jgi:hypothetical protein
MTTDLNWLQRFSSRFVVVLSKEEIEFLSNTTPALPTASVKLPNIRNYRNATTSHTFNSYYPERLLPP